MRDAARIRRRVSRADRQGALRVRTQRDDGEVRESVRAHAPGCASWRQQSGGDGRVSVYATFTHVCDPFDNVLVNVS